jgi:hypothetical protein
MVTFFRFAVRIVALTLLFTSKVFALGASNAVLACSKTTIEFMVRFSLTGSNSGEGSRELLKAGRSIEQIWRSLVIAKGNVCSLPDGREVSVSSSDGPSFAYGFGGGDPDRFFSLKIGGQDAYYKQRHYAGREVGWAEISSVRFDGLALMECRPDDSGQSFCHDESIRLGGNALTAEEKSRRLDDDQRLALSAKLTPFCKGLPAPDEIQAQSPLRLEQRKTAGNFSLSLAHFDFDSDGLIDVVYRFGGRSDDCRSCGSHYFDGSMLIVFLDRTSAVTAFEDALANEQFDIEKVAETLTQHPEWKGFLVGRGQAGSSIRYVYNVFFSAAQRSYVYAFETNNSKVPSSVVDEIIPNGRFETRCRFP